MITLGLDIGSNSVGSAWVDTETGVLDMGASVFPAGVEEQSGKRGAPVNQNRRQKRQLRRSIARRAERKRLLKKTLTDAGLLPQSVLEIESVCAEDPWQLRRKALSEPLTPYQFGRVLLHLNQRRGASNIVLDEENKEEGAIKEAMDRLRRQLDKRTVGEFMAGLMEQRASELEKKPGTLIRKPIRNRLYRLDPKEYLYADRTLIREEFNKLWNAQKSFSGPLAALLTDELRKQLDDPSGDRIWQSRGLLFGQRRQYWDTGTLGHCSLEPTDLGCPLADMYAQEFRVIESVNNIRIEERGKPARPLTPEERSRVIAVLRSQKTATPSTVRKALGLNKKDIKEFFTLNIERDKERSLNTDWFWREIVLGVWGEKAWQHLDESVHQSVNRAIQAFDPEKPEHIEKLRRGCGQWWRLDATATERLVAAWQKRPTIDKRLKLSRRAIRNLLPYMNRRKPDGTWPTQMEARIAFAEDGDAVDQVTGQEPTPVQRRRYSLKGNPPNRKARRFTQKHPDMLPPAPILANPVVRKAIHEVRRHVTAYLRKYGRRPDRVVIELAREAKLPAVVRDKQLATNRQREKIRKAIADQYDLRLGTTAQQRKAEERVLLCRQQRNICPYCGGTIDEKAAANGAGVEIDHIVPFSRCGDNSLNNRVLCHTHCNRGKGSLTPKEWLSPEDFAALETRLAHFEKPEGEDVSYFTHKDFSIKWENLHREGPAADQWRTSALTDTAYASTQVASYLAAALYPEQQDAQRIFFTKGLYTSLLRRDWQLQDAKLGKIRDDHRHHAVDAVAIALTTPERLQELAVKAREWEQLHSQGADTKYPPIAPPAPWKTVEDFRNAVMAGVHTLVVAHRPSMRRLAGAFHQDTAYGPVLDNPKRYTVRVAASDLKPGYLKLSQKQQDDLAQGRRPRPADDPPIDSNSYLVRDLALRLQLRKCLKDRGLDPDAFTEKQLRALLQAGPLRMASGVPIKSAVCLKTIENPVVFPRYNRDIQTGRKVADSDPRSRRIYIGGNNHHAEIRENAKGQWSVKVVTMIEAARRVRAAKDPRARSAVDRSDTKEGRFIMSLSIGETVHMRHPVTNEPGYFTVFKIDPNGAIHVTHHWDARPSKPTEDQEAREDIRLSPSKFKNLGPSDGIPPYKVHVNPLGEPRRLEGD
jgi:CRISPR-associated endonuclease Csn1